MAKLVRLRKTITDAILTVLKYVSDATGEEPTQEEIATALKSYFIMNEISNQIKFQREKKVSPPPTETVSKDIFWTLNLMTGPSKTVWSESVFFAKMCTTPSQRSGAL